MGSPRAGSSGKFEFEGRTFGDALTFTNAILARAGAKLLATNAACWMIIRQKGRTMKQLKEEAAACARELRVNPRSIKEWGALGLGDLDKIRKLGSNREDEAQGSADDGGDHSDGGKRKSKPGKSVKSKPARGGGGGGGGRKRAKPALSSESEGEETESEDESEAEVSGGESEGSAEEAGRGAQRAPKRRRDSAPADAATPPVPSSPLEVASPKRAAQLRTAASPNKAATVSPKKKAGEPSKVGSPRKKASPKKAPPASSPRRARERMPTPSDQDEVRACV